MANKERLFDAVSSDDADLCTRLILQGIGVNSKQVGFREGALLMMD